MWIRDLQFITPEKIAIVTEYKHLRVYNTTESRRPFVNIAVGESPLRSIVSTDTFGIVGDNCGHLVKVCYTDKKPIGTFQGSAGSIVQLAMHRNRLFCVGMDRFLRVFDIQSREEIEKVYLKQRMTGIALMREDEDDQEEQEEASVEELWNDMEDVDKSESE